MNDLPQDELEFFRDPEHWMSGPTFDLTFYGVPPTAEDRLLEAVCQTPHVRQWTDGRPSLPKTIFFDPQILPVGIGFIHSFVAREDLASYQLSIYPPQMGRIFSQDYLLWGRLNAADLASLGKLYRVLLPIAHHVCRSLEVGWVEIASEDWPAPFVEGSERKAQGIWVSQAHAEVLGFQGETGGEWVRLPLPASSP